MTTPVDKLANNIGHQCENDHGVLADVVLVQLATGETNILCQPCLAMLMAAALAQVEGLAEAIAPTQDEQAAADAAAAAVQAAQAALA